MCEERIPNEDQISRTQLAELSRIGSVGGDKPPEIPLCIQVAQLRKAAEQHCSQISDLQQQLHTLDKSFVAFREKVRDQLFSE